MLSFQINAQITFGVKISGLAFHPKKGANKSCYRWKVDEQGRFVGFVGVTLTSAYYFNDYLGLKLSQTFMPFDCAGQFSSVTHLGLNLTDRIVGWKNNQHRGSASIGPLLYLRKGWLQLIDCPQEPDFINSTQNKKWQYKFVWYGGQMQYDYYYRTNRAVSINIFPGHPYVYSFGVGETFRIE